jgi:hypothetical protein
VTAGASALRSPALPSNREPCLTLAFGSLQMLARLTMIPIFFAILQMDHATLVYLLASSGTAGATHAATQAYLRARAKPSCTAVSASASVAARPVHSSGSAAAGAAAAAPPAQHSAHGPSAASTKADGVHLDELLNACIIKRHRKDTGVLRDAVTSCDVLCCIAALLTTVRPIVNGRSVV